VKFAISQQKQSGMQLGTRSEIACFMSMCKHSQVAPTSSAMSTSGHCFTSLRPQTLLRVSCTR